MRQAIERENRQQIKEVAQLMLGKAAAAGLKDVATQAAKLVCSVEGERSWIALRQAVAEFAKDGYAAGIEEPRRHKHNFLQITSLMG